MAGGTEFAGAVKILHHGLGVAIEMSQYLLVGNLAVNRISVCIHHDCRLAEHITSRAARIDSSEWNGTPSK